MEGVVVTMKTTKTNRSIYPGLKVQGNGSPTFFLLPYCGRYG
jgi:hypothetical protein